MTTRHKLGWLALIGAIVLLCWKMPRLHGQGFGSFTHDQPFLSADPAVVGGGATPMDTSNLFRWWHAGDLADGAVSGWTDRIAGVILSNEVAIRQPTKTSNYVSFTGSELLTNKASGLNVSLPKSFFVVMSLQGVNASQGILCALDGYYPAFRMFNATAIEYRIDGSTAVGIGTAPGSFEIFDWMSQMDGNYGLFTNYFNGAYNANGGPMTLFGNGPIVVGHSYQLDTWPLRGRIYDIFVYTNRDDYATVAASMHGWRTNYYP